MIFNIVITVWYWVLLLISNVLTVLTAPFDFALTFPYSVGLVFGNIWLLNDLLPVSDLFFWFGIFVTLNLGILTLKAYLLTLSFLKYVRRTFLTISG